MCHVYEGARALPARASHDLLWHRAEQPGQRVVGQQRAEEKLLDAPASWLPLLAVTRAMLDMRCPKRAKTVHYWRCHREIFAVAGEGARWDGLTERLTFFEVLLCFLINHA